MSEDRKNKNTVRITEGVGEGLVILRILMALGIRYVLMAVAITGAGIWMELYPSSQAAENRKGTLHLKGGVGSDQSRSQLDRVLGLGEPSPQVSSAVEGCEFALTPGDYVGPGQSGPQVELGGEDKGGETQTFNLANGLQVQIRPSRGSGNSRPTDFWLIGERGFYDGIAPFLTRGETPLHLSFGYQDLSNSGGSPDASGLAGDRAERQRQLKIVGLGITYPAAALLRLPFTERIDQVALSKGRSQDLGVAPSGDSSGKDPVVIVRRGGRVYKPHQNQLGDFILRFAKINGIPQIQGVSGVIKNLGEGDGPSLLQRLSAKEQDEVLHYFGFGVSQKPQGGRRERELVRIGRTILEAKKDPKNCPWAILAEVVLQFGAVLSQEEVVSIGEALVSKVSPDRFRILNLLQETIDARASHFEPMRSATADGNGDEGEGGAGVVLGPANAHTTDGIFADILGENALLLKRILSPEGSLIDRLFPDFPPSAPKSPQSSFSDLLAPIKDLGVGWVFERRIVEEGFSIDEIRQILLNHRGSFLVQKGSPGRGGPPVGLKASLHSEVGWQVFRGGNGGITSLFNSEEQRGRGPGGGRRRTKIDQTSDALFLLVIGKTDEGRELVVTFLVDLSEEGRRVMKAYSVSEPLEQQIEYYDALLNGMNGREKK